MSPGNPHRGVQRAPAADGFSLSLLPAALGHLPNILRAALLFGLLPAIRHWRGGSPFGPAFGQQLRQFLERSGLIYLKLGQYLAMRTDLVPAAIGRELDRLFEDVAPMPFHEVEQVLEEELGVPWQRHFAALDPAPIGSASVAQVHRATLPDGRDVAVKVQRLGVRRHFRAATWIFRLLAWGADALRLTGELSLRRFFDEFVEFTLRELDFELEGRTAERLRSGMSGRARAPVIEWPSTTRRLLTMELVEGKTFLDLCRVGEEEEEEIAELLSRVDLLAVVEALADECFRQLFITGFFHGDPHPGNVVLTPQGDFVFLDFGIFGEMTPAQRHNVKKFVENLALGRFSESAVHYTRLCRPTAATDLGAWMFDLTSALAAWHTALGDPRSPIEQRHLGHLQAEVTRAMRRHQVQARPNQLLVWRALVLMDSTTLRLPIEFDMLGALTSFFRRANGPLAELLQETAGNWLVRDGRLLPELAARGRTLVRGGRPSSRLRAERLQVRGGAARPPAGRAALVALSLSLACLPASGVGSAILWLSGSLLVLLCAGYLRPGSRAAR